MKIAPSIICANFLHLKEELETIKVAGVKILHIDVMDGVFVPNITFGHGIVSNMRKFSSLFFDVHLMIQNPYKYVRNFAEAGANAITFHVESESDALKTLQLIKSLDVKAGIAIKPNTSLSSVENLLNSEYLDQVLLMTVEPGFAGQEFLQPQLEKLKSLVANWGDKLEIAVDGGINEKTLPLLSGLNVSFAVVGSALYKNGAFDKEAYRRVSGIT